MSEVTVRKVLKNVTSEKARAEKIPVNVLKISEICFFPRNILFFFGAYLSIYQAFSQNFSQIISNYYFCLQCSTMGHSGNLSEESLSSCYKLILGSSHLNVVFITK